MPTFAARNGIFSSKICKNGKRRQALEAWKALAWQLWQCAPEVEKSQKSTNSKADDCKLMAKTCSLM